MDPRIRMSLQIIKEHKLSAPLSASEMGSLLRISEAHFLRLFRKNVGISYRQYQRYARIEGAAELLTNGRQLVKEVADVAGYKDASNFCRDFRQTMGTSPRRWQMKKLDLHLDTMDNEVPLP